MKLKNGLPPTSQVLEKALTICMNCKSTLPCLRGQGGIYPSMLSYPAKRNNIYIRPLQVIAWFLGHHLHQVTTTASFHHLLVLCMCNYAVCYFTCLTKADSLKGYVYTSLASLTLSDPISEASIRDYKCPLDH